MHETAVLRINPFRAADEESVLADSDFGELLQNDAGHLRGNDEKDQRHSGGIPDVDRAANIGGKFDLREIF